MHQPEHTPRTLFVDDESINQQIGAEILLALGAEADTADNGLQALRLIRTRHYAIVFTDVEMPVMDGATLTHILRFQQFLSSFRQVSILSGLLFSWSYWYFRGLLWQAYVILKTLNVITLRR